MKGIGQHKIGLSLLLVAALACSPESITDPDTPATLHVLPIPDHAHFSWTVTSTDGFAMEGRGEAELIDLAPGRYTVSWEYRLGWDSPPRRTFPLGPAEEKHVAEEFKPPVGFVEIPPGSFMMGTPESEPFFWPNEYPQHFVTITPWIHIQSTEVTNLQYMRMAEWALMSGYCRATPFGLFDAVGDGSKLLDLGDYHCEISYDGDEFSCVNPDHPVKEVTWYGAAAYCNWMSVYWRLPPAYDPHSWRCNNGNPREALGFRLPTEAEWEYSCRAGTSTAYSSGAIVDEICCDEPALDGYAWYCEEEGSFPVAKKLPNSWQLFDMHGNLSEWCNDWYSEGYSPSDQTDPTGAEAGVEKIQRGGNWGNCAFACRSARRGHQNPETSIQKAGFRVLRTAH